MTLTFDLLTPKSIGHILDSWGASVWSFMIIGGLQSQLSSGNHFQTSVTDRQTDGQTECKPIVPSGFTGGGLILDSWWVSVWSFMIIGWLQSQLSSGNHFQITMRHDLDLWPFDLKINRAHPWLMVSKCMKFHDHRLIIESVIVRKPFSNNHAPWPWPLTFWPQNQ